MGSIQLKIVNLKLEEISSYALGDNKWFTNWLNGNWPDHRLNNLDVTFSALTVRDPCL